MIAVGVLADNDADVLAGVLDHFAPGEAAIVDGHFGKPVGSIEALMANGRDLWLVAAIVDAGMAERLSRGPTAISIEAEALAAIPRVSWPGTYLRQLAPATSYRGLRGRSGWTLLGCAVLRDGEAPARPGSALWTLT